MPPARVRVEVVAQQVLAHAGLVHRVDSPDPVRVRLGPLPAVQADLAALHLDRGDAHVRASRPPGRPPGPGCGRTAAARGTAPPRPAAVRPAARTPAAPPPTGTPARRGTGGAAPPHAAPWEGLVRGLSGGLQTPETVGPRRENQGVTEDEEVRSVWLRSHVERCLEDIWERFPLETDGDGDWPFRFGTAGCWVHVEPDGVGTVRVVAIAARELKRSAKLLAEVNDVNARTLTAHAYFTGGHRAGRAGPARQHRGPGRPGAGLRCGGQRRERHRRACWPRCSTGRPCSPRSTNRRTAKSPDWLPFRNGGRRRG